MRRIALLALLLPLLMALNCPVNKFAIVMQRTPDGKVQRELTVWTGDGSDVDDPKEHVLVAAESAYGDAGTKVGKKQRFSGTFSESLPADLVHEGLTNHGLFGTNRLPMGSVCVYVERMPGRTDLVELFRIGEQFAETFVRALSGWAAQQPSLQAEPEKLKKLVAFLQTEFHDDVLNTLLMTWQAITRLNTLQDGGLDSSERCEEPLWNGEVFRGACYFAERGYLRPDEVTLSDEALSKAVYRGVLRKAAAAMGCAPTDPLPPPLDKLADPDDFDAAFEEGLTAIGISSEEFGELLDPALPAFWGNGSAGQVVWRCKTTPVHTNGKWDAEKGELTWDAEGRQGCETPQLLFAVWTEPDETFQKEHLGRVMLDGERLAEYVTWRAGLSDEQRAEWAAFITDLRPGKDPLRKLEEFRFSRATTMPSTMPADQGADDLTRGAALILGR